MNVCSSIVPGKHNDIILEKYVRRSLREIECGSVRTLYDRTKGRQDKEFLRIAKWDNEVRANNDKCGGWKQMPNRFSGECVHVRG